MPFVFLALLGAARGDTVLLLAAGAVPLLCKEDGALVASASACSRSSSSAAAPVSSSAARGARRGAVVTLVVMPRLRERRPGDLIDRYRYLGATPGRWWHLVTSPQTWIGHLLSAPAGPALLVALAGVGLLPLLRPAALAACLPPLLLALVSSDPFQSGLRLQYGLARGAAARRRRARRLAGPVGTAARSGRAGAAPRRRGVQLAARGAAALRAGARPARVRRGRSAAAADAVLARIPADAPVAATGSVLTHLAERPHVFELPAGVGVEWIAVDEDGAVGSQSRAAGYGDAVSSLPGRGYSLVAEGGGVALWRLGNDGRRGDRTGRLPPTETRAHVGRGISCRWYRCRSACR